MHLIAIFFFHFSLNISFHYVSPGNCTMLIIAADDDYGIRPINFWTFPMSVIFAFFHSYDQLSSWRKYYISHIRWPLLIVAQSGCYIEYITSADFIGCYYLNIGAVDFTTYHPMCIVVWFGPCITCSINWAFVSQRISWKFSHINVTFFWLRIWELYHNEFCKCTNCINCNSVTYKFERYPFVKK